MKLIIAEKPVLGQAIADALPGHGTTKDGCIYKGDYVITWLFGHMLALKEPEDYDIGYKKWSLDALPIFFPDWGLKIGKDTGGKISKAQRVNQIGGLLSQADEVIHAGDPDDEGQLLVDELLRWFDYKGPVKRLDTANTTAEAMRKSFDRMTDNKAHEPYGFSAYARSVADLMVGVNMSRLFTCMNNVLLTIGRVQTPALGLVVARDAVIEGHQKQTYYTISAELTADGRTVTAQYEPAKNDINLTDGKILDKNYAETVRDMLMSHEPVTAVVTKKTIMEDPPLPFNLVKLQSYCSGHFGYSPQEVLDITQSLRENHKAITYNRSDCQYLSDEHFKEAPSVMAAVVRNISFKPKLLDMSIKSKCFNSSKISAHFAIIPTDANVDMQRLTERERNVYLAVCKYYMAQFMPKAEKEQTKLIADLGNGASLKAVSTVVVKPGYRSIFKDADKDVASELSLVPAGSYISGIANTRIDEKETKPPSRYTKASLNEDMTRISKYVSDEKIKKLLLAKDEGKEGERGSIGTSATRSGIIENLIKRGFLEEKGRKLISTPLGRELYRILPDEVKKPDMTALWWAVQEDIQLGKRDYNDLINDVHKTIQDIVSKGEEYPKVDTSVIPVKNAKGGENGRSVVGRCPVCGSDVISGKLGFGCSNWKKPAGCKFVLWKKSKLPLLSKITVTPAMAEKLLKGEEVHTKKLYSPGKNKTFEGNIVLKNDPKYGYCVQMSESTFKGLKKRKGFV